MRIKELQTEDMTLEQKSIKDEIVAGPRGKLQGPLKVWLTSPNLADKAQKLGQFCRYETSLPAHLSELAILVTGRFWGAEYEWYAHKKIGLDAGLDPKIVEAIRQRRTPIFNNEPEKIIYEFATQLHNDHRIADVTYAAAVREFGEVGAVDLVGILGYYTLISMTLNTFNVPLPEGIATELD
ncbi:MAG: carboxymuconolactone decarboxylase family protein [Rhodospirillaceae bacterium]|nr:carboxymuconolactone decarboxylase family protein [Rhodospirillaceae bacterium]MBT5912350.1 carboxymuconolactone decarboxylase family protein [Rhodospirillaceae bacterium]MDC0999000.1 carboxymuconolactone decarboxylase family protein [Alphaproteobacteria bacterium]MDC1442244.1 carboxymuconolactone decarboxylase family protein [Rhodospirillaceae bacterium]